MNVTIKNIDRLPLKDFPRFQYIVKGKIEFLGMIRGKENPIYLRFLGQLKSLKPELVKKPLNARELLLQMYHDLEKSEDYQRRGYLLQDLLKRLFELCKIPVSRSFTRNQGAEQIDCAFKHNGWYFIVECRWRNKLADIRELDGLKGQVERSGKQTMGFFLSIKGWSENVPQLLKHNPLKSILLMNGDDLRCVLDGSIDFRDFIEAKLTKLNFEAEPYYGAEKYLKDYCSTVKDK